MSDENLTDEQIEYLLANVHRHDHWLHVEGRPDITVGMLLRYFVIERAKVARLEAMVTAQDEVILDERQAHELKGDALVTQLGDAANEGLRLEELYDGREMMSAELIFPKRGE